jgi:hypothetical protein
MQVQDEIKCSICENININKQILFDLSLNPNMSNINNMNILGKKV